ncbi:MAG: hypothetical protein II568_08270, partial [Erysipelotrichaceae bacterium]|nr:hypothetical protein [Erysipelotrichaceae bacterium]
KARYEERNNRFNNRNPRKYNSEKRYIGKKEENAEAPVAETAEVKAAEEKTETVEETVAKEGE